MESVTSCATAVDGLLVEPGDTAALATAMRSLIADRDRREAFGAAGRQRFVQSFHIDRFAERFDRFLQRVSLRDASHAGSATRSPIRVHSTPFGTTCAVLGPGEGLWIGLTHGSAARLAIETTEDATIMVHDGAERRVRLTEPGRHRLPIDTTSSQVGVSVVEGQVWVDGVIEVGNAT